MQIGISYVLLKNIIVPVLFYVFVLLLFLFFISFYLYKVLCNHSQACFNCCIAKTDLEFIVFLLYHSTAESPRLCYQVQIEAVWVIKPRAACMLRKHFTN